MGIFSTSGDEDGFWIDDVSVNGSTTTSLSSIQSSTTLLKQNYPNPSRGITTIPILLKEQSSVQLAVYNLQGQRIWTGNQQVLLAGKHELNIQTSNWPEGVYVYELHTERAPVLRKIMRVSKP